MNTVGPNGRPSAANPFATKADPACVPTDPQGNPVTSPSPGQKYAKAAGGSYVCDPNTIPERAIAYRQFNGLPADAPVPVDAVTASGSGLDPDISVQNALDQAPRVARARHLPAEPGDRPRAPLHPGPPMGFPRRARGQRLELNLALDGQS